MDVNEIESIQKSLRQSSIDQASVILSNRAFNQADQPTVEQVILEAKRIMRFINTGD